MWYFHVVEAERLRCSRSRTHASKHFAVAALLRAPSAYTRVLARSSCCADSGSAARTTAELLSRASSSASSGVVCSFFLRLLAGNT